MKRPVPPLIWPNSGITSARAQSIISTKMGVLTPPVDSFDVVNKEYLQNSITIDTYPRSVLFTSDPPGLLRGIQKFTYNDIIDTVYLDGSLDITSTTGSLNLSGGRVTGISDPVDPNDAANKAYVDAHSGGGGTATGPSLSVQYNSGGLFSGSSLFTFNETLGSLSLGSLTMIGGGLSGGTDYSITGLSYPTNASDAANKAYVDAATGSSPGLPFNSVQFNSAGIFGGSADLTFDGNTFFIGVSTPSTNTTTGSLVVAGGAGINGDVFIGGTCNADEYLTTSDQRFKTNINKIDYGDVDKLLQLSGYTYNLRNHDDLKYGLMAQEIENVGLDHFVKNVGDHKKVNYQYFIPVLIESIKTLKLKLDELESLYNNNI